MQTLTSLEELLEVLPNCSGTEFIHLAQKLDLNAEEFESYAFWDADGYTRNCISRNEDYELLLLCWQENHDTPVHDHNGEECWVYALKGELEELRYRDDSEASGGIAVSERLIMKEGDVAYMHDNMGYHSLHNRTAGQAMTLHLYMKPIDSCKVYDEADAKFIRKDLQYTTFEGQRL